MIIVRIQGGLGNQMFQYAFGRYLSVTNKTNLKIDNSYFNNPQNVLGRKFLLNYFDIKESYVANSEIEKIIYNRKNFIEKIINKRNIVIEQNYEKYNSNSLKVKGNIYLIGYFQSEKYFKLIEKLIRREFQLKDKVSSINKLILERIIQTESVAIHVRRGDYLTNSNANSFHGLCSKNYYRNAIEYIETKLIHPVFIIFSDDYNWSLSFFGESDNIVTISPDKKNPQNDLYLMSHCKHQVIANSSYSWWGAWLNNNPNKIVIAPKNWYNQAPDDATSPVCENWIKL